MQEVDNEEAGASREGTPRHALTVLHSVALLLQASQRRSCLHAGGMPRTASPASASRTRGGSSASHRWKLLKRRKSKQPKAAAWLQHLTTAALLRVLEALLHRCRA